MDAILQGQRKYWKGKERNTQAGAYPARSKKMEGIRVYKFVSWDVSETIEEAMEHSKKMQINAFIGTGTYKLMGYMYDARHLLKKYIIKYSYGGYEEVYSDNVKNLRDKLYLSDDDKVALSPF